MNNGIRVACVLGLIAAGCTSSSTGGGGTEDAGKGGASSGAGSSSSGTASSSSSGSSSSSSGTSSSGSCDGTAPFSCVSGTPGGQCGDALEQPTCTAAAGWTCPQGTIPTSQCACLGLPAPGCSCTPGGWECVDSGAGPCTADPLTCVSGTPGGQCGDALLLSECVNGNWACPQGTINVDDCACVGLPIPGCTCTATGWNCPLDGGTGPRCRGLAPACVSGVAGGACSDALESSGCTDAGWTCPRDTIPVSECACIGRPPGAGCTCTALGWNCPVDGGSSAPVCRGIAPSCVSGVPGGQCSDALEVSACTDAGWACPADTIPVSECACIGRPPGACACTPQGWACADAGFSRSDAGRGVADAGR